MDYRKEVIRRKELENSSDQKIILILSSLILVAVIIVGAIMTKMLYDNNKQLKDDNRNLQKQIDYIFPDSDKKKLTEEDVKEISNGDIKKGINEIYARHGRIFEDSTLQEYFESKSWYHGEIEAKDRSQIEEKLNEYEKTNIKFLETYLKK